MELDIKSERTSLNQRPSIQSIKKPRPTVPSIFAARNLNWWSILSMALAIVSGTLNSDKQRHLIKVKTKIL